MRKKLVKWGRVVAIGMLVVTAVVGWYQFQKNYVLPTDAPLRGYHWETEDAAPPQPPPEFRPPEDAPPLPGFNPLPKWKQQDQQRT